MATEAFAEATSQDLATKTDLERLDHRINLLQRMIGFVLAFQVANFAKLFLH